MRFSFDSARTVEPSMASDVFFLSSFSLENDSYTMLVAHEFFDALPTHIFEVSSLSFRLVRRLRRPF